MTLLVSAFALVLSSAPPAMQNCKPTASSQDAISKQRRDVWIQTLSETGFLASVVTEQEVEITGTIGQYGNAYALNIELQKREEKVLRSAFESAYRAVKGNQFAFGFVGGQPLTFTATDVSNNTKISNVSGDMITTVVLSATLTPRDLAMIRETLTSSPIDAVRVSLAGDLTIQKKVNDKNGRKMQERFACFYKSLESKGVNFAALMAPAPASATTPGPATDPAGRYNRKGRDGDYITLKADSTFELVQDGRPYAGTYAVSGSALTVTLSNGARSGGTISGNQLVDDQGTVWIKGTDGAASGPALTIDQIVQMVAAKLPDDIIIAAIAQSSSKFDLNADNLIKLKTAGASDAVLRALIK